MAFIHLYDMTLREGAQEAGASFTVEDKLRILTLLDNLGVSYVEGGNPGSNPKDIAFYERASQLSLRNAKLAAFGSTARAGVPVEQDENLRALLSAHTPVTTIFGKSWDFHVQKVLRISLEENLALIEQSIAFLRQNGKEVVFDAEHFFDGYKQNAHYALQTLQSAQRAGADWICLCDTNGGCFPHEVEAILQAVQREISIPIAFHGHNDVGMADANAITAARNGVQMLQATLCGVGERCGNTNLCTLAPNLQLKLQIDCLPEGHLSMLHSCTQAFEGIANLSHSARAPYVGRNAFTHKAGMHIDAIAKSAMSFEHIDPAQVGAKRRILLSDQAGRMAILQKAQQIEPSLQKDSPYIAQILQAVKEKEYEGYQFEQAEASFALLVQRLMGTYKPFFQLRDFKVIVEQPAQPYRSASALIEVCVGEETEITAAMGNGPVNALDRAARKALERFYPALSDMYLSDFKVRVLDSEQTTASIVRVLIESRDERDKWTTVGVSADILQASWIALVDSLEYKLLKDAKGV